MQQMALARLLSGFQRLRELNSNRCGKDYFVGDIHGQYDKLQRAMAKTEFNPNYDRLFSTGNLINYGNDSLRVLSLLSQDWFFAVLGIQELYMLDALQREHYLGWYTQGGDWAFDEKLRIKVDLAQASEQLYRLPIAYRIEQKKQGDIGVISGSPLLPFTSEGFQQATLNTLYHCLQSSFSPNQKAQISPALSCVVCGGPAAQKIWAKGNTVAINQGARYLPAKGKIQLHKTKKLLRAIHKQTKYQPLLWVSGLTLTTMSSDAQEKNHTRQLELPCG